MRNVSVCYACTSTTERDALAVLTLALASGEIENEDQFDRLFDQREAMLRKLERQHRDARCTAFYATPVVRRRVSA